MSTKDKTDPFDPEQLRLNGERGSQSRQRDRQTIPRHQEGEKFLKGPIPLNWLAKASLLSGKALHVSLAIWHRAGLENRGDILLTNEVCALFAVNRYAKQRGLVLLEQAGLIRVERKPGKNPRVTLLAVTESMDDPP